MRAISSTTTEPVEPEPVERADRLPQLAEASTTSEPATPPEPEATPAPAVTDAANVVTHRHSPTRNDVTGQANVSVAKLPSGLARLAQMLGPEAVGFYQRSAEFARTPRPIGLMCRRCRQAFVIQQRGHRRAKWPTICPSCIAAAAKRNAANWRERRRHERLEVQSNRHCGVCGEPMPAGRADRRQCSPACRQRAYRRRSAATTELERALVNRGRLAGLADELQRLDRISKSSGDPEELRTCAARAGEIATEGSPPARARHQ
jgi:predicted nucleic acid-binding Zn ribbon protein